MISIDASVWVSLFVTSDRFHSDSYSWFYDWELAGHSTLVPSHFLAEVAGAIARLTLDPSEGVRAISTVYRDPSIGLIAVDDRLADQAAHLASNLRLRGSDAIYVALARQLDIPLITWDDEQLQRAGQIIDVMTPAQALERMT